jgi:hypothetical protein
MKTSDVPHGGPAAGEAVAPSVTMKLERIAMRSWVAFLLAFIQVRVTGVFIHLSPRKSKIVSELSKSPL